MSWRTGGSPTHKRAWNGELACWVIGRVVMLSVETQAILKTLGDVVAEERDKLDTAANLAG